MTGQLKANERNAKETTAESKAEESKAEKPRVDDAETGMPAEQAVLDESKLDRDTLRGVWPRIRRLLMRFKKVGCIDYCSEDSVVILLGKVVCRAACPVALGLPMVWLLCRLAENASQQSLNSYDGQLNLDYMVWTADDFESKAALPAMLKLGLFSATCYSVAMLGGFYVMLILAYGFRLCKILLTCPFALLFWSMQWVIFTIFHLDIVPFSATTRLCLWLSIFPIHIFFVIISFSIYTPRWRFLSRQNWALAKILITFVSMMVGWYLAIKTSFGSESWLIRAAIASVYPQLALQLTVHVAFVTVQDLFPGADKIAGQFTILLPYAAVMPLSALLHIGLSDLKAGILTEAYLLVTEIFQKLAWLGGKTPVQVVVGKCWELAEHLRQKMGGNLKVTPIQGVAPTSGESPMEATPVEPDIEADKWLCASIVHLSSSVEYSSILLAACAFWFLPFNTVHGAKEAVPFSQTLTLIVVRLVIELVTDYIIIALHKRYFRSVYEGSHITALVPSVSWFQFCSISVLSVAWFLVMLRDVLINLCPYGGDVSMGLALASCANTTNLNSTVRPWVLDSKGNFVH